MRMVQSWREHMIVTSSNLATNLLLDLVGVEAGAGRCSRAWHLGGIDLRRGVEDEAAWEAGINNRVTADGLCALLRADRGGRGDLARGVGGEMLDILHEQRVPQRASPPACRTRRASRRTRPARSRSPRTTRASCSCDGREPYVVAILTEWEPGRDRAQETHRPHLARRVRVHDRASMRMSHLPLPRSSTA